MLPAGNTQKNQEPDFWAMFSFAYDYQFSVESILNDIKNLETNNKEIELNDLTQEDINLHQKNLDNLFEFITLCRNAHSARLAQSRSYSLSKEASENELGHEAIEAPLAIGSMGYIPIIFMELYLYYSGQKNSLDIDMDRFKFELSDAVVWSIINILRLEGKWHPHLNAENWEHVQITLEINQSLLLAGYGFDLINQIIYDYKVYKKNEKEIERTRADILGCVNILNSTRDQETYPAISEINSLLLEKSYAINSDDYKTQLLLKKHFVKLKKLNDKSSDLFWKAGAWNTLYSLFLITGASYKLVAGGAVLGATTVTLGMFFIVLGTTLNQLKNWGVSVAQYRETIRNCKEKTAYLNTLVTLEMETDEQKRNINYRLIELGIEDVITDFTKHGIEKYKIKQDLKIKAELWAANKKITLDSAWYALTITSISCLSFASGPIGITVFAGGLAAYGLFKFAYSVVEYVQTLHYLYKQDEYLEKIKDQFPNDDNGKQNMNLALVKLGLNEINFSEINDETKFKLHILKQRFLIGSKIDSLNDKMAIECLLYMLALATFVGFVFGGPAVGLVMLMASPIIYYSAKTNMENGATKRYLTPGFDKSKTTASTSESIPGTKPQSKPVPN